MPYRCSNCESDYDSRSDASGCCECSVFEIGEDGDVMPERDEREDHDVPPGITEAWEGVPLDLRMMPLQGRPIRVVSIEQEVSLGGHWLAGQLFAQGLTPYSTVLDYGDGGRGNEFCRVESDSSCDAEVIFNRLDLTDPLDAKRLRVGLDIARRGKELGEVRQSFACGFHIHVDLHGVTPLQAISLSKLWNYLEDPIFRLGSAGWSGHRGTTYARFTPKFLESHTRMEVLRGMAGDRYAFHLGNYFSGMNNCSCGARILGVPEECTCNMGKLTGEFRVFNATSNPRKVLAYVALAQGLVARAQARDHSANDLPGYAFQGDNLEDFDSGERATKITERLDWMISNVPLQVRERRALAYCAEQSSLAGIVKTAGSSLEEIFGKRCNERFAPVEVPDHAKRPMVTA